MFKKSESLAQLSLELAKGISTATQLAERSLAQAMRCTSLNAFIALDESYVMVQAQESTMRWQQKRQLSPIDGIPIALKDNYLTEYYPTTACSHALPLEKQNSDATVVANLRAAGANIFGKTNMHEWAFGATNSASVNGATLNPLNPLHITGGSSGGSAAAVAAGIVSVALGSDTGGSVRIPAAACGIYGFKPSYGRASRSGILPLSWSLDAPGPMASTLEDIGLLLPYFLGEDPRDATTKGASVMKPIPKVKQTTLINLVGPGLERSTEVDGALVAALSKSLMPCSDIELPHVREYFAAWEAILHCEASAYHDCLLDSNAAGFTSVTRAHLEAGRQLTAVEYLRAQTLRANLVHVLLNELPAWDALVLPTLPVSAPRHDEQWQEFGGRRVSTQDSMTWFCWIGNLTGLPCLSIPMGASSDGLPLGMMLMGKPGMDEELLSIGHLLDQSVNG